MRILLVEDDSGIRDIVGQILSTLGYADVVEAEDGEKAWDQLHNGKIDLLITDKRMPVMDGLELVRKVRQTPQFEHLPILMFSGFNEPLEVRAAIKSGIDDYLAKPFTPQQLYKKLNTISERQSRLQIKQIINGQEDMKIDATSPLIVFCEEACTEKQLQQSRHQAVRQFLWLAIRAIHAMNHDNPDLYLGYLLESKTHEITRLLRQLQTRIRILTVSPGISGGITLARLASINKHDLTVILACDAMDALPEKERIGLKELGVFVMKRNQLSHKGFYQLFREFVSAESYSSSDKERPDSNEIQNRIETDIKNTVSLPVLPDVYHEIVKLDRNLDSNTMEWARMIDKDPLSSAMVIRRARSPIYGLQGEITNTRRAVVLLGKNTVKELIVCQAVKQAFSKVSEVGFNLEDYWLHSLAVAVTARILSFPLEQSQWTGEREQEFKALGLGENAIKALEAMQLAKRFSLTSKDDPFSAGMMHDIGKVAMVTSYPGLFPAIVEELENQSWQIPMLQAEERIGGGVTHASAGTFLAQTWGLNKALTRVTGQHHAPVAKDHLSKLITLADFIGGAVYPFPQQAHYPSVEMLGEESKGYKKKALKSIEVFLPERILNQFNLKLTDFLDMGRVLVPNIKQVTENLRKIA